MRLFSAWVLLTALVSSGRAGDLALSAKAVAPVGIAPLLLGQPLEPAPELAAIVAAHQQAISAMTLPDAADFLVQHAEAGPLERASAKILAGRLAAAAPQQVAAEPVLQGLADSGRADPALAAWFDGGKKAPTLGLEGLSLKWRRWEIGDKKLQRLGRGAYGFVDVHPSAPGVAIKTTLAKRERAKETAESEESTARFLAVLGAGPRYLGRTEILGRQISASEQVYGETIAALSKVRRFGPEELSLVYDLLRGLSDHMIKFNDLHVENIMIGHTLLNPRRRAFIVDGGGREFFPGDLDAEGRFENLLKSNILGADLDRAVARSGRKTWLSKAGGFVKDLLADMFQVVAPNNHS